MSTLNRHMAPRGMARGGRLDRWLSRATRLTAVLLVAAVAIVAAYWVAQRYVHPTLSVLDRDSRAIEEQIRRDPGSPQLRVAAANLYVEKGSYDAAIAQAEQVLESDADHLGALAALGLAYAKKGDLDSAAVHLAHAVESSRDNPMARASLQLASVHQSLADIYLKQGRFEDAAAQLQAALNIDRGNADALHLLGNAQAAMGLIDDAIESYRRALRLVPQFPEVYSGLQRAYEQRGDLDRAAFALGMVSFSAGDYDRAVETLEPAVQALPDMADAHLGLAMAYEAKGQRSEALEEYRKTAALDDRSIAARQGIGRLTPGR